MVHPRIILTISEELRCLDALLPCGDAKVPRLGDVNEVPGVQITEDFGVEGLGVLGEIGLAGLSNLDLVAVPLKSAPCRGGRAAASASRGPFSSRRKSGPAM